MQNPLVTVVALSTIFISNVIAFLHAFPSYTVIKWFMTCDSFLGTPPQVDSFAIRNPIPRIEDDLTPVTMYLDCSGSGDPPPTYQFKRNNIIITDAYYDKRLTVLDNTLTIKNLNTSDGGIYICLATNRDGTVLREVDVKIRGGFLIFL